MRVMIHIPKPGEHSSAAHEETEETIAPLIESLIRRCRWQECNRVLPRNRSDFCSDAHMQIFWNRKRYR
jgi:hypothetical protein